MQVDVSHYPIVIQTIDAQATPERIGQFFAEMRRLGDRAIRDNTYYVSITVTSGAFMPVQRAKVAEEIRKTSPEQAKRSLGSFVIVSSALVRGSLTAVKWLALDALRTVMPVATWDEAVDAAVSVLRENSIPLPATINRLRSRAVG